jgi:hypothetical protein
MTLSLHFRFNHLFALFTFLIKKSLVFLEILKCSINKKIEDFFHASHFAFSSRRTALGGDDLPPAAFVFIIPRFGQFLVLLIPIATSPRGSLSFVFTIGQREGDLSTTTVIQS